jgi:DNA (cytosine-5)-methyltransferase 1
MLKVVDLFCGPGGISEGLRLAGFETVYALDKDGAATATFKANHPEAVVVRRDVTALDPDNLPDFDILVGGPPCVEFSASKGNRGNILEGLRLVQEFLRVVYFRQPKYWIMENVPRIVLHLPEEIPLSWIGVNKRGHLHIPRRSEFNCADFGVPQNRRRYLVGRYPSPKPTHFESAVTRDLFSKLATDSPRWKTVRDVLARLPDPLASRTGRDVVDPNFGINLKEEMLTDHFHPVVLNERESRSIRKAKVEHPYMGFMPFPDDLDRPARTVVATQLGRETLVLPGTVGGTAVFRRATIRECASLQSFPITYQFHGGSINAKYRLVGDAVPPRLAYQIGVEIRNAERPSTSPLVPDVRSRPLSYPPPLEIRTASRQGQYRPDRKFAELIPGKEVRGCRVELTNRPPSTRKGIKRSVGWYSPLYVGEGKKTVSQLLTLKEAIELVRTVAQQVPKTRTRLESVADELDSLLHSALPSAEDLQSIWSGSLHGRIGPEQLVDKLSDIINRHFPRLDFSDTLIDPRPVIGIALRKGLRIRIAIALLAGTFVCELISSGSSVEGQLGRTEQVGNGRRDSAPKAYSPLKVRIFGASRGSDAGEQQESAPTGASRLGPLWNSPRNRGPVRF